MPLLIRDGEQWWSGRRVGSKYTLVVYRATEEERQRCASNPWAHSRYTGSRVLWHNRSRWKGPKDREQAMAAARERLSELSVVQILVRGYDVLALVDDWKHRTSGRDCGA